jgi:hypothetical protein
MAIKLLGVEGANETSDCTSQDFLLVTHAAFFVANEEQYVDFPAAVFKISPIVPFYFRLTRFFFGISPPRFRWRGAWAAVRSMRWTSSPLVLRYFSQVPFRLGPDRAAKFCAVPRQGPGVRRGFAFFLKALAYQLTLIPWVKRAFKGSKHLLRDRLRDSLQSGHASFDFLVQLAGDLSLTPIDDATVRWSEHLSPYVKVATIAIEPQNPDTTEMKAFAEHLAYSPWHALTDHRPLGSINKVRKEVYRRMAVLRHDGNSVVLREPAPGESPGAYLDSIGWRASSPASHDG